MISLPGILSDVFVVSYANSGFTVPFGLRNVTAKAANTLSPVCRTLGIWYLVLPR